MNHLIVLNEKNELEADAADAPSELSGIGVASNWLDASIVLASILFEEADKLLFNSSIDFLILFLTVDVTAGVDDWLDWIAGIIDWVESVVNVTLLPL